MKSILILAFLTLSAQLLADGKAPLPLQPGQSVYIVAVKVDGKSPDLSAEGKARSEFAKRKKFPLAANASGADFVALVLTEYESFDMLTANAGGGSGSMVGMSGVYLKGATCLVLGAKDYAERKGDLDKLRDAALWVGSESASRFKQASVEKLVRQFHEQAVKK